MSGQLARFINVTLVMLILALIVLHLLATALVTIGAEQMPKPQSFHIPVPQEVVASWYGDPFHGRTTASGTVYDKNQLTAAHRTMKFGTRLTLLNPLNGRQVDVEITDRGPYNEWKGVKYFKGRRDIDLSEAAAEELGVREQGVATLFSWEIE